MSKEITQHKGAEITPYELIAKAVESNFDLDKLDKLMQLQERWEAKQAKKAFFESLAQFQSICPVIKKGKTAKVVTKTGGSFSYKYADLGEIVSQIKDALKDCGLSYRWSFQENGLKLCVTCHLSHILGHTESTTLEAMPDSSGAKNDIQMKGSTQTYLQRYTLIGALGISTADEDTDGAGHKRSQQPMERPEQVRHEPPSEDEAVLQWKESIDQLISAPHCVAFYNQNKKAIDANPKLQALLKEKRAKFPKHQKTDMP